MSLIIHLGFLKLFTYIFFKFFAFFRFNMPSQKSDNTFIDDKKAILIRLRNKAICLTKKFFQIVIKITNFYN